MITVDIVSPIGGDVGGIENVILSWTRNLDPGIFDLRVFHCHQGTLYLHGYEKAYCINRPFQRADINDLIAAYTVFIKEYGAPDICVATNWPMMVKACEAVRRNLGLTSMKLFSWIHNRISAYEEEGLGGVPDMIYADAHLTINRRMSADIRNTDREAVIYEIGNPVVLRDRAGGDRDPMLLTYVGRLSYIKRIDIILEAIYRAGAEWRLRIIGDGELRSEVEGWIELLGLGKRVEMLGWQQDPWLCCQDSDILVMASEYEGFGLVAFEASSAGKMVISTPVDGVSDYIEYGKNGYIYPFEDAGLLADILNGLAEGLIERCDPEECRRSVEGYSEDNYFKKLTDILML
ncbi:MAG: glycosyltransferase [Lachnospiraceae bacterium]|nr:glycosyltransferase [Lachnospiraceae bacterium]